MLNKKLTDSEIKKALDEAELFLQNRVKDGQPIKLSEYDVEKLRNISQTCAKAYDKINRQQTDNESLKVENQSLRSAANSLKMHYEEAQAEIERLKEFIVETRRCDKEIKSEARKEFAERLKDIFEHAFQFEYGYLLSKDVIYLKLEKCLKDMEDEN